MAVICFLFNVQIVRQLLKDVAVSAVKTPFICHSNAKKNYVRECDSGNTFLIRVKGCVQDSMNQKTNDYLIGTKFCKGGKYCIHDLFFCKSSWHKSFTGHFFKKFDITLTNGINPFISHFRNGLSFFAHKIILD